MKTYNLTRNHSSGVPSQPTMNTESQNMMFSVLTNLAVGPMGALFKNNQTSLNVNRSLEDRFDSSMLDCTQDKLQKLVSSSTLAPELKFSLATKGKLVVPQVRRPVPE